jgi:hypothetical protein
MLSFKDIYMTIAARFSSKLSNKEHLHAGIRNQRQNQVMKLKKKN